MNKNLKKIAIFAVFAVIVAVGYSVFVRKQSSDITPVALETLDSANDEKQQNAEFKTFKFDNFHGSSNINPKFEFQYPANWYNDGQYFSSQNIQYYNQFTVKAPIYFDLVLSEIFHLTELQYQIDNSKRRSPDTIGQIEGKDFKRYDLTDYGSYGGDSAGRVKIFVGPKIKIDGADYILVFHWEEKPLAEHIPSNNVEVFDNILLTLKFLN